MTPPNGTLLSPTGQRVVAVSPVLALLPLPPVVMAQRAGDAMYDFTLATTGNGYEAALEYHRAFQAAARRLGCGPICGCDDCETQFGSNEPGVENPAYAV
jgi:hypothetical protein